jgi:hypothetical protein
LVGKQWQRSKIPHSKHCNAAKLNLFIRCQHFLDHVKWADVNIRRLESMGMMENGQVESDTFFMVIGAMLRDEPHFKNSLLYGLTQCVMARCQGNVNARGSEKMVAFCQVLNSLSPKIYEVFRKKVCGYNPRTLRRKATKSRATSTIFDISEALIKHHISLWIDGLKSKELLACTRPKKVWILSVAADATKIPGKVEFCEPYGEWVGGIYPDHIVPHATFDPDLFVSATLAHEIKVGLALYRLGN